MGDKIFAFLNQGWVGLVGGIVVAIITFFASKRRAAPKAFITASRELVWGNLTMLPPGFELKFQGKDIPRISRGMLRFWNGGNETLSRELIPAHDRIRLVLPDGEFLLVWLAKAANSVNKCSVERDQQDARVAYLDFDFLDADEGAMVGFLHSSSDPVPAIHGTIKGHKIRITQRLNRDIPAVVKRALLRGRRVFPSIAVFTGFFFLAAATFPLYFLWLYGSSILPRQQNLFLFVAATYIGIGCIGLWSARRQYPKSLELNTKAKR